MGKTNMDIFLHNHNALTHTDPRQTYHHAGHVDMADPSLEWQPGQCESPLVTPLSIDYEEDMVKIDTYMLIFAKQNVANVNQN